MNELKSIEQMTVEEALEIFESFCKTRMYIETAETYYEVHLAKTATIYFLKDVAKNLIKIGHTKGKLKNRISTIKGSMHSVGNFHKLKLVKSVTIAPEFAAEAEKELHEHFAKKRKYGEWFKITIKDINDFYYEHYSYGNEGNFNFIEYSNCEFDLRKLARDRVKNLRLGMHKGELGVFSRVAVKSALDEVVKISCWAISIGYSQNVIDANGRRLDFSWKGLEHLKPSISAV